MQSTLLQTFASIFTHFDAPDKQRIYLCQFRLQKLPIIQCIEKLKLHIPSHILSLKRGQLNKLIRDTDDHIGLASLSKEYPHFIRLEHGTSRKNEF